MSAWPKGTRRDRLARSNGPVKRIHVNKHIIGANLKRKKQEPAITVQTSAGSFTCHCVSVRGPSVMRSNKPLKCGARIYLETTAELNWI